MRFVSSEVRSSRFAARSISKPTRFPRASISTFHAIGHFPGLHAGLFAELDVETVGLGVVVKLHGDPLRKRPSKNALWMVSPSSRVTTRRTRVKRFARSGEFAPEPKTAIWLPQSSPIQLRSSGASPVLISRSQA